MIVEGIDCAFVVSSEVTISPDGAQTLEKAFRARLHLVEHRLSHARIPTEPVEPRGTGVRRIALLPDA